jgi:phospholipid/cholesterol/gamma-HCH transport system permease protein
MAAPPSLDARLDGEVLNLTANGSWTVDCVAELERIVDNLIASLDSQRRLSIDMSGIGEFDTYGAWLLERLMSASSGGARRGVIVGLPDRFQELSEKVHEANSGEPAKRPHVGWMWKTITSTGRATEGLGTELFAFAAMLGALGVSGLKTLTHPRSFRLTSFIHHLDRVGFSAVPIVLLITFLIGGIIAQQGIFHFRKFGAEVYVVDMVGILILREIGVLIVAIMVAGRSGSSYTAELGAMKMREEIDALRTMGLDPVAILLLPRVLALIVALPLLTFLGSMAALYGGCVVAWFYGGMSPDIFLTRLKEAISVTHFEVGMIKAPFMALAISVVACAQGMRVQGSADSLGLQTTASVVKSIFLVIVLDGLFAVFFASIEM